MLNERQLKLYSFLQKNRTHYVSKESICNNLPDYYPRKKEKSSEHNSLAFNHIRQDVRAINSYPDTHRVIVSNTTGYKIANKEEAISFIERRMKRDLRSMKTTWGLKTKIGKNGQVKMAQNELKEIKAFVKGI